MLFPVERPCRRRLEGLSAVTPYPAKQSLTHGPMAVDDSRHERAAAQQGSTVVQTQLAGTDVEQEEWPVTVDVSDPGLDGVVHPRHVDISCVGTGGRGAAEAHNQDGVQAVQKT